jgi:hypothetical protein
MIASPRATTLTFASFHDSSRVSSMLPSPATTSDCAGSAHGFACRCTAACKEKPWR